MNDPRIPNVRDVADTPSPDASDLVGMFFRVINSNGQFRNVDEEIIKAQISESIIRSRERPPYNGDRRTSPVGWDSSVVFFDNVNGNLYISDIGSGFHFVTSRYKSKSSRVIGSYTEHTGSVNVLWDRASYTVSSTQIVLSVHRDDREYLDSQLSDIKNGDKIHARHNSLTYTFNITSAPTLESDPLNNAGNNRYTFTGSWESTFVESDFQDVMVFEHEPVTFKRFLTETIWEGTLSRTQTDDDDVQSLNAGKKFSDYELLYFYHNNLDRTLILSEEFESGVVRLSNWTQGIKIRWDSDTTFSTTGGHGTGRASLNKIVGQKYVD